MDIRNYIKLKRICLELSLDDICDGICTKSTLSKFENGKLNLEEELINKLLLRVTNTSFEKVKENTQDFKNLANNYIEKLILNQDRKQEVVLIEEKKDVFLKSEHSLVYFLSKTFNNYNIYDLATDISTSEVIDRIVDIEMELSQEENFFIDLYSFLKEKSYEKKLEIILNLIERDIDGIARHYLADMYYHEGKLLKAHENAGKAYTLSSNNGNLSGMFEASLLESNIIYDMVGMDDTYTHIIQRSLRLAQHLDDEKTLFIYYNQGSNFLEKRDLFQAKKYLNNIDMKKIKTNEFYFLVNHKFAYLKMLEGNTKNLERYLQNMLKSSSLFDKPKKKFCDVIIKNIEDRAFNAQNLSYGKIQSQVEFIYNECPKYFNKGLQKFYQKDYENVMVKQRRYKDLYYLLKN